MPSYSKLFLRPFIGGLNTETSDVEDMVLNTSDELNCTILPEAMRGRRYGFNIERDGNWDTTAKPTRSYSGYLWKNVNKTSDNFIVLQVDTVLKFYQSVTKPISQKNEEGIQVQSLGSVDISAYVTTYAAGGIGPLNYAIGDGALYVVNSSIQPLQIRYSPTDETNISNFTVNPYNLYIRDFDGVEDGLEIDEMPAGSSTSTDLYGGLTNEHHYNLLNQGWKDQDLLDFVRKKNKWPSNNLQWYIGKDNSGDFDTEKLLKTYFGNTPAPKGHYILNYFTQDRSEASALYGITPKHSHYWFDKTYIKNGNLRGYECYQASIDLAGCIGEKLRMVIVRFNSLGRRVGHDKDWDFHWLGKIRIQVVGYQGVTRYEVFQKRKTKNFVMVPEGSSQAEQYHIMSSYNFIGYRTETNGQEVILADETFSPNYGDYQGQMLAYNLQFENDTAFLGGYKVKLTFTDGNNEAHDWWYDAPHRGPFRVDADFYGYIAGESGNIFPVVNASNTATDITYMGNRLFYLVNDTVLFSQAIGNNGQGFEKCYQDADPTSEEVSDILPTDGGLVKLNNIGVGRALETFNRGVLVFGDNIVYGLISPVEKLFTATEYDIVELSRAGIIGPRSAVSTDDMVYYWSPLGIFRIGVNPNTGTTLVAQSITNTTIQTFYNNIPNSSKQHCRGVFDYVANRIYWYYPLTEDYWKLDGCLVYDLTNNAFMPFKIGEVEEDKKKNDYLYTDNLERFPTVTFSTSSSIQITEHPDYSTHPFITDAFQTNITYEIEPTMYLSAGGNRVVAGDNKVLAAEIDDKEYHRWTAIQHSIAKPEGHVSFGDYNDREFKDFDKTVFDSYMVSKPITLDDTYYNKQVPIMQTLFKRTEEAEMKSSIKPELVTYNLSDYRSYTDNVHTSGEYHPYRAYAVTAMYGNTGSIQSCDIKVDASEIGGLTDDDSRELVAEVYTADGTLLKRYQDNITNFILSTYNIHMDMDTTKVGDSFKIIVSIGNHLTRMANNIHFTATVDYLRTNPLQDTFTGWEEVELEGDVSLPYHGQVLDPEPITTTSLPPSLMKKISLTVDPVLSNVGENVNWSAELLAKTNSGVDFFAEPAYKQQVGYAVVTKEHPTKTPREDSIDNLGITLSTVLTLGYKGNFLKSDCTVDSVNMHYKLTAVTPVYEASTIKPTTTTSYIAASGAYIRMRWGWSLSDRSNRWDMVQNAYRPQKDFMYDEFVESRLHIRGRGKAFQVEIRNDENKDMRLAGLNLIVRNP